LGGVPCSQLNCRKFKEPRQGAAVRARVETSAGGPAAVEVLHSCDRFPDKQRNFAIRINFSALLFTLRSGKADDVGMSSPGADCAVVPKAQFNRRDHFKRNVTVAAAAKTGEYP
jgi:hypothetical protein